MASYAWLFPCAHPESQHAYPDALAALGSGCGTEIRRVVCIDAPRYHGAPYRSCRDWQTLWGYNASPVLRQFARDVALGLTDRWNPPPIVLRYLHTGNESIRAAAENAALRAESSSHTARGAALAATTTNDAGYGAFLAASHAHGMDASGDTSKTLAKSLAARLAAGRKLHGQRAVP